MLEEILLQDNNIDGALYGMPEGICQLQSLLPLLLWMLVSTCQQPLWGYIIEYQVPE
jgi:hypothetical protein